MSTIPEGLVRALAQAEHVAVLTGAGMSAESGVPTFRDASTGGLWLRYRPEELATPEALRRQPDVVWAWYRWRRERVRQARPHAGHFALVRLAQLVPRFTLITQNVDGLHQRSGLKDVIELHGNILRTRCIACGLVIADETQVPDDPVPHCPQCRGLLRPDVVFFGEALPRTAWERAWQAAHACDVMLVIGTSALVEPAASLPRHALEAGAVVAEINPQTTPLTPLVHYAVQRKAGEVLPALVEKVASARLQGG